MNYLVEGVIGKVLTRCARRSPAATAGDALLLAATIAGRAARRRASRRAACCSALFVAVARPATRSTVYATMYRGAFGSAFSWQNTLARAAPLMLTALCAALPARLGLMVIGNEGALVLGGLAAAVAGHALAGARAARRQARDGGRGALVGGALDRARRRAAPVPRRQRDHRSLLLNYIAIALFNHLVEGPLRDPASLNKPSTLPDRRRQHARHAARPGRALGAGFGVLACVPVLRADAAHHVRASRAHGGRQHPRRAADGLPVGAARRRRLRSSAGRRRAWPGCRGGGGARHRERVAGRRLRLRRHAGRVHRARTIRSPSCRSRSCSAASRASGGLLQRCLELPDATVNVLQGMLFLVDPACRETFYGRRWLSPRGEAAA